MKLLIDECLPRTLKRLLGDHECRTVQEMGWSGKKNGELLSLAELEFDVLVTVDQGMEYEQNLANRKISRTYGRQPTTVYSGQGADIVMESCAVALQIFQDS